MAHPSPSATPSDSKEHERETWVARMSSLSNFRHRSQRPAASPLHVHDPHVQSALPPLHDQLPRTNWPLGGAWHRLPPPRRLRPPPPHNPGPDTYTRGDEPDDPHLCGTWERKSLDTLLSIRSGNQGLGRAMYCLAKWTQRSSGISTDWWLWKVELRPQQKKAPPSRRGPTPPRPTSLQLWRYRVAARLMALLWPGPDTPTQNYPQLTSAPSTTSRKRTHMSWSRYGHPPGNPPARTAETTPAHRHLHLHWHQHAEVTRESARTCPVPEPAPSSSLLAGPSILRPPPQPRALLRPP